MPWKREATRRSLQLEFALATLMRPGHHQLMTSGYDGLLGAARAGDRQAARALRPEAERRGDAEGLLTSYVFDQPSDDNWTGLCGVVATLGHEPTWVEPALDQRWPDVLRSMPIDLPSTPWVEWLTKQPGDWWMFRLARCLGLSDVPHAASELALLATNPKFARVRALRLRNCELDAGRLELLRGPLLAQLHTLDLSHNSVGDAGAAVVATMALPKLAELELAAAGIQCAGADALANAPFAPTLRSLDLSANTLNVTGAESIARGKFDGLTKLKLVNADLGEAGIRTLSKSPPLRALLSFDARDNHGGLGAVRAFAETAVVALRELRLSDEVGEDDREGALQAIANSSALRSLEVLDLANYVGLPEGMRALSQSAYITRLRWLDLTGAWIGDEGAKSVVASSNFASLEYFSLVTNDLHDAGLSALSGASALPRLTHLHLDENDFTENGVRALLGSALLRQLAELSLTLRNVEAAKLATFSKALPLEARLSLFRRQPLTVQRDWASEAGMASVESLQSYELEDWIDDSLR